jgi:hypothetical protein
MSQRIAGGACYQEPTHQHAALLIFPWLFLGLDLRLNYKVCIVVLVELCPIEKKLQLEAKIKAMQSMSKALDILIAECPDDGWPVNECPILGAFRVPLRFFTE